MNDNNNNEQLSSALSPDEPKALHNGNDLTQPNNFIEQLFEKQRRLGLSQSQCRSPPGTKYRGYPLLLSLLLFYLFFTEWNKTGARGQAG